MSGPENEQRLFKTISSEMLKDEDGKSEGLLLPRFRDEPTLLTLMLGWPTDERRYP